MLGTPVPVDQAELGTSSFLSRNIFQKTEIENLTKKRCGPGSVVRIATAYGLDGRGSNPGGVEIFRTCPDRP